MRLMVTGANGQVGWELVRSLAPLGEVIVFDRSQCDLLRPHAVADVAKVTGADVIVNAAAYTAVDRAEEEEEVAQIVNGAAVQALAEVAHTARSLLVHYSTDYVFDGNKDSTYIEDDVPAPINAYGRSKFAGEEAIRNSGCDYLILRSSWVYAARGQNFVRTILRLACEREELGIVADQTGTPNWARNVADATAHIVRQAAAERALGSFASGIFHLTASGSTTWYEFAVAILQLADQLGLSPGGRMPRVRAIRSEDYSCPAARPKNSRLCADRLRKRFGIALPSWRESVRLCLQEIRYSEELLRKMPAL